MLHTILSLPHPLPFRELLGHRTQTILHAPASIQGELSAALASTVNRYCQAPNEDTLFTLLSFPKLVMCGGRGHGGRDDLAETVRHRLVKFLRGDILGLWEDLLKEYTTTPQPSMETRASKRARIDPQGNPRDTLRRIRRYVGGGATRKGLDTLLSTGIHCSADPAVLQKLQELHPSKEPPPLGLLPQSIDPTLHLK